MGPLLLESFVHVTKKVYFNLFELKKTAIADQSSFMIQASSSFQGSTLTLMALQSRVNFKPVDSQSSAQVINQKFQFESSDA